MPANSKKPDYILVGKSIKAQGLKGEVKILPFSGVPDDLLTASDFELRREHEAWNFKAAKSRSQGRYLVVKFVGVDDRDRAETLAGFEVWAPEDVLPELAPDEFYWHEMEGLRVVTVDGRALGRVASLMATGGHDVLVIKDGGYEYLVPAAKEIIVKIDVQNDILVIDPPPGLLEINDPDAL
ncbi:MAG: 16S rRNA processing protein RimM [Deltaproteobacteria bacterium]|nr:16S rRNA processing protein RimM [Deltaproteobacteria bacterium]